MWGRVWARKCGTGLWVTPGAVAAHRLQETAALGARRGRLAPKPRVRLVLFLYATAAVLIRRNDKREKSSS